ncbi:hypothetical protein [Burkholderia sp. IDO3]|uniref:hypothetical protein n=1 Tax=Burkholderia sp. IDO3 TaxID=1705310 RepID=UPI0011784571|nr:hypothetical protein [Burkholderia sp. IDO3]
MDMAQAVVVDRAFTTAAPVMAGLAVMQCRDLCCSNGDDMATGNYALIENGVVANVIVWDGNTDVSDSGWEPPSGALVVEITYPVEIGWAAAQQSDGSWAFSPPA